jgi:hypothetical protein
MEMAHVAEGVGVAEGGREETVCVCERERVCVFPTDSRAVNRRCSEGGSRHGKSTKNQSPLHLFTARASPVSCRGTADIDSA